MKISNIEFNDSEWTQIVALAKTKPAYQSDLTPPNILRLACDLPTKQRGGVRKGGFEPKNTHNPKARRDTANGSPT